MPFYDYKCADCGKKFEALHGMGGKPAGLQCEHCGSLKVNRIFHAVGSLRGGHEHEGHSHSSGGGCSSCSSGTCGSCH